MIVRRPEPAVPSPHRPKREYPRRQACWRGLVAGVLLFVHPGFAIVAQAADAPRCAQPLTSGPNPATVDCLFILRSAVGLESCDPACICLPRGVEPVAAADALLCLRAAVGLPALLVCPCSSTTTSTTMSTTTTTTEPPHPIVFDCTDPACPSFAVEGDPYSLLPNGSPSPFRGYADASIRRDPGSGSLWMAYSWPHLHVAGMHLVSGVEIHLARSDDDGQSWVSGIDGNALWPAHADTDRGGDGRPGFTDLEVASILPVAVSEQDIVWYGARLAYFVAPPDGHCLTPEQCYRPPDSFRLLVARAPSVQGLAGAETAVLGGAITSPSWGPLTDLSALDPGDDSDLEKCLWWNEPALWHESGTLYLAARCMAFFGPAPDVSRFDLVVFATDAQGDVADWQWRHVGRLTGASEAAELGGVGLTQIDLAEAGDGTLLALVTPDDWDDESSQFVHMDCRAVELESIEPPVLRRVDGAIRVRAILHASDQGALGPGSCAYEATSLTGIVMAKRDFTDPEARLVSSLHRTNVHP